MAQRLTEMLIIDANHFDVDRECVLLLFMSELQLVE